MAQIPSDRLVTIYGGSGFVGRHLVRALAKRGWRIRVAVRRPDLAGHLQPLGVVGQVMPVQANLRFPDSVARDQAWRSLSQPRHHLRRRVRANGRGLVH